MAALIIYTIPYDELQSLFSVIGIIVPAHSYRSATHCPAGHQHSHSSQFNDLLCRFHICFLHSLVLLILDLTINLTSLSSFTFGYENKFSFHSLNHELLSVLHIDTLWQILAIHENTIQVINRSIFVLHHILFHLDIRNTRYSTKADVKEGRSILLTCNMLNRHICTISIQRVTAFSYFVETYISALIL